MPATRSQPLEVTSAPRQILVCGGGCMGAATIYSLTSHPKWRKGVDTVTLIEETEIAAGASGKAGQCCAQIGADRLTSNRQGGFLEQPKTGVSSHQSYLLIWGLICKLPIDPAETLPLGRLAFELHAKYAKEHDGATHWGYRRLNSYSANINLVPSRSPKKPKTISGAPWLNDTSITKTTQLGNTASTAQVTPRLFTNRLVELALAKGAELHYASVDGLDLNGEGEEGIGQPTKVYATDDSGKRHEFPCTDFVFAAGPWCGNLAKKILPPDLADRIDVTGERAHSIIVKAPEPLSAHAVFCQVTDSSGSSDPEIYARPDGTAYLCGTTDSEPLPATAANMKVDPEQIKKLVDGAAAISPSNLAKGTVEAEQVCFLPMARGKGCPLLGLVSPGIWAITGHTCWGITLSTASGHVLAELMLDGSSASCNIESLDPQA